MNINEKSNFDHFKWVYLMANRIISREKTKPMLCLSFNEQIPIFNIDPFLVPFSIEHLSTGIPYSIILSLFEPIDISNKTNIQLFEICLNLLSINGYKPCLPCSIEKLISNSYEDHINLCQIVEFAIFEKSINIDLIISDLKKIPRSFFVLNSYPHLLEDAIKLWLENFHCVHGISSIENLQNDISRGYHVAAIFSRTFPKRILKTKINLKEDIDNIHSNSNWILINPIIEELGLFIPNSFPTSEKLFYLFFADIFHATRATAKKFVKLDPPPIIIKLIETSKINNNILPKLVVPQSNKETIKPQLIKKVKNVVIQNEIRPKTTDNIRRTPIFEEKILNSVVNINSDNIRQKPEISPISTPRLDIFKQEEDKNEDIIFLNERPQTANNLKEITPKGNILNLNGSDLVKDKNDLEKNYLIEQYKFFSNNFLEGYKLNDPIEINEFITIILNCFNSTTEIIDYLEQNSKNNEFFNHLKSFLIYLIKNKEINSNIPSKFFDFLIKIENKFKKIERPRVSFVDLSNFIEEEISNNQNNEIEEISKNSIPLKDSTTIPNYQTIINSLKYNCLPGPIHEEKILNIQELLLKYKFDRFYILLSSRTLKFKGIYLFKEFKSIKIYGIGPDFVEIKDVKFYFKFINGTKSFEKLFIESFTQTTDAFCLLKEPSNW